MKRLAALALALLTSASFAAESSDATETKRSARREAERISNQSRVEVSTNTLPRGRESQVLGEMRRRGDVERLIRVRDQQTIDESVERFIAARGVVGGLRHRLQRCASPWLLVRLGPLLYEEDEPNYRRGVDDAPSDYGYSMSVAQIMLCIAAEAPEFTDATRAAAKDLEYRGVKVGLNPGLIKMTRRWWEANEVALREERYRDVTPPAFAAYGESAAEDGAGTASVGRSSPVGSIKGR